MTTLLWILAGVILSVIALMISVGIVMAGILFIRACMKWLLDVTLFFDEK